MASSQEPSFGFPQMSNAVPSQPHVNDFDLFFPFADTHPVNDLVPLSSPAAARRRRRACSSRPSSAPDAGPAAIPFPSPQDVRRAVLSFSASSSDNEDDDEQLRSAETDTDELGSSDDDDVVMRFANGAPTRFELAYSVFIKVRDHPATQSDHRCNICLHHEKRVYFVPCGHAPCCKTCAEKLGEAQPFHLKCPICRESVNRAFVYYPS